VLGLIVCLKPGSSLSSSAEHYAAHLVWYSAANQAASKALLISQTRPVLRRLHARLGPSLNWKATRRSRRGYYTARTSAWPAAGSTGGSAAVRNHIARLALCKLKLRREREMGGLESETRNATQCNVTQYTKTRQDKTEKQIETQKTYNIAHFISPTLLSPPLPHYKRLRPQQTCRNFCEIVDLE
jgi:hypothetical protein